MLRVGVIGCGRIGSEFDEDPKRNYVASHSTAYVKTTSTKLVAVCDVDKSKAIKCAKRCMVDNIYTDYREMLKKENLDIVSVCTSVDTHSEIVKYASGYVRGIYCEKPIASTLKQAQGMIDICKKNNVILQINHQRRFGTLHKMVKRVISSEMGDIRQVTFYYNRGIYNTGSHMFDLLNWFFDKSEWVNAFEEEIGEERISGVIKFSNGIICNVIHCNVDYPLFEMDIIGTDGRIRLTDGGMNVNFYKVIQSKQHSENKELREQKFPCNVSNSYEKELTNGVVHIVDCIKNSKESASSGDDGYKSLLLITAFLDSAFNKERLYLRNVVGGNSQLPTTKVVGLKKLS